MLRICCSRLALIFVLVPVTPVLAQTVTAPATASTSEAEYTKVIQQRADKIVATLGLTDAAKTARVRDEIAQQYRDLRDIQTARDAKIKTAREAPGAAESKSATDAAVQAAQAEAKAAQDALHPKYLARLSADLTPEQIDKVKDGMTYGVLPLTYRVYQQMLPDLTEKQKAQILAWLVEARENAMDAGTSKEKHAWFGKYKGKIGNYLSAAGYDMKKAEKEMMDRQKTIAAGETK